MLVISRSLVLSAVQTYDADNPIIGYDNCVAVDNITADEEASGFPASNLANPLTSTAQEWRGTSTAAQALTVLTGRVDPIDYIGVAAHNFGSEEIAVAPWGRSSALDTFEQLAQEVMPADDTPLWFRVEPQSFYEIEWRMASGNAAPRAAVLYAGALLVMERGIYVGHVPLPHGVRVNAVDGPADSGDYLGSISIGEYRETTARFRDLDPDWFRTNMVPFLNAAHKRRKPFFWCGRPSTYPREAGFARLINNPDPAPAEPSHKTAIELQMRGIA